MGKSIRRTVTEEVAAEDATRPASEDAGLLREGRVKYVDAPADIAEALESAEIIEDFLPSPEELKEAKVTVIRRRSKGRKRK